jgi:hypothetical protein
MAKTAQINIKIDGKQAQDTFDNLRVDIKNANSELTKIIKKYGENSKQADNQRKVLAKLSNEYDNLSKSVTDLNVRFDDLYEGTQPMTTRLGEIEDRLYELSLAGQTTSREFQDLINEAGRLRQTIIQTDLSVDAMAMTMTQKLMGATQGIAGVFAIGQGAASLFGVENENVEKALLKVSSAMSIVSGIDAFKQSLPALKSFGMSIVGVIPGLTGAATATTGLGMTMNALPIVAIISGVALLTAGLYKYSQATKTVSKEERDRIKLQDEVNEKLKSNREQMTEEIGSFQASILLLKETNAGSKERSRLLTEIGEKYDVHLKNLKDEELFQKQINEALNNYVGLQRVKFFLAGNEEYLKKLFLEESVTRSLKESAEEQLRLEQEKINTGRGDLRRLEFLKKQTEGFDNVIIINQGKQKKLAEEQLKLYSQQNAFMDALGMGQDKVKKGADDTKTIAKEYGDILDDIQNKLNREIKARKELNKLAQTYSAQIQQATPTLTNVPPTGVRIGGGGMPTTTLTVNGVNVGGGAPTTGGVTQPPRPVVPKLSEALRKQLEQAETDFYQFNLNLTRNVLETGDEQLVKLSDFQIKQNEINQSYLNDRFDIIKDAIDRELKVERDKFTNQKITAQQYVDNVQLIYDLAESNLLDSEKELLRQRRLLATQQLKELSKTEKEKLDLFVANARIIEMEITKQQLEFDKQREIDAINKSKSTEEQKQKAILKIKKDYQGLEIQMIQEMNQYQLRLLELEEKAELSKAQSDEEKMVITRKYTKKRLDLETKMYDEINKKEEDTADKTKKSFEDRMGEIEKYFSRISNSITNVFNASNEMLQQQLDQNIKAIEKATQDELQLLEGSYKERLISEDEYQAQKAQIEQRQDQETRKLKREQFYKDKRNNITNAIAAGAQSVLQALASSPPPLSFILAGLAGTAAAFQIATIKQGEFTAALGGLVPGNGKPNDIDSVKAKLAPGEAVINAKSTSMFPQALSFINQAGGGIPLTTEVGVGDQMFGGQNNNQQPIKAYVVETEISEVQTRINRIKSSVEF